MLILTRRVGESVVIGDKAEMGITVLAVKGGQIKLGINAPKDVSVHREEIYQKIQAENLAISPIGKQGNEEIKAL